MTSMLFSGGFSDLTRALPQRIMLGGIAYLDPADLPWKQATDLAALIAGLTRAGINLRHASDTGEQLIAGTHFPAHARTLADLPTTHHLYRYVNWDAWTERIRADFTPVLICGGVFDGTWYAQP